MSVFKPGQVVSYRGKTGIVDGVNRTPGMVDVRYGRLVKRHAASDLMQDAKSNPRRARSRRGVKTNPKRLNTGNKNRLKKLIFKYREAISYRGWKAVEADWAAKSKAEKDKLLADFAQLAVRVEKESGILSREDQRRLHAEEGVLATYRPLQEENNKRPERFKRQEEEERKAFTRRISSLVDARKGEIEEAEKLNQPNVPVKLTDEEAKKIAHAEGYEPLPKFSDLIQKQFDFLEQERTKVEAVLKADSKIGPVQISGISPRKTLTREDQAKLRSDANLAKSAKKVTPASSGRGTKSRVRQGEKAPAYFGKNKVGFEVRPDPPRFPVVEDAEGNHVPQLDNLCGNPIDGTIYILAVKESGDGVRRDISRVTTVADVEEAKAYFEKLSPGEDVWPSTPAEQIRKVQAWLRDTKNFYESYTRYKVNERTETGRIQKPYSVEDVKLINDGGVLITGKPRVRKARKSLSTKGRLQISGSPAARASSTRLSCRGKPIFSRRPREMATSPSSQ